MQDMMGNMMGWGAWGPGMMLFMMVFWIAILVLIIVAIVYMVRQLKGGAKEGRRAEETPLDILKKRYARGKMDRQEFEEKKRDLM